MNKLGSRVAPLAPVSQKMAQPVVPVRRRCSASEVYNRIEQMCVQAEQRSSLPRAPLPSFHPVLQPRFQPRRKPGMEPEDITEDGFSPPPARKKPLPPPPESDPVDPGGATAVSRASGGSAGGGGGGGALTYPYRPNSRAPAVPPEPLAPVNVDGAVPVVAEPFYKNPVVLVGGAILAVLLLKR